MKIRKHNKVLRDAMFARGCQWVDNGEKQHFILNGKFEPYPVGYIRCPYKTQSPRQYSFMVQGPNGWLVLNFYTEGEGEKWAIKTATKLLEEQKG